jgi:hypothetical protein
MAKLESFLMLMAEMGSITMPSLMVIRDSFWWLDWM